MRRILLYEYLSAGGEAGSEAEAQALLSQGVSMRDAVLNDLLRVDGVKPTCAVCARPGANAPTAASGAPLDTVAARSGERAADFVRRVSHEHDLAWVIAPESGAVLAELHQAVGQTRWVGSRADAIRTAASKRATVAALHALRVATPLAFEAGHAGRWVVKPDDGAGAIDTHVHPHREAALADLQARKRAGLSTTLEPYVEGEPLSISLLAGPGSAQPLACNRQRIGTDANGVVRYLGVEIQAIDLRGDARASRLHTVALDVVRALPGLRGFVGIDLVWHPERGPVVIEVNPRVTCAYVGLSSALGRNLAAEILLLRDLPEMRDAR